MIAAPAMSAAAMVASVISPVSIVWPSSETFDESAESETLPAVEIVASFVSAIAADAFMSAFAIVPSVISEVVTVLKVASEPRPSDVRPVAALRPVAPPSHFKRSVYAVSQFGPFALMSYPSTVPVRAMLPAMSST